MRAHCLFEQSGTFKNEFKKLGIEAYDYDILNNFGETDYVVDLFQEIENGYEGKPSIFDNIRMNREELGLDEVKEASEIAQIRGEIEDMPMKYYTMITDMGMNLSGGQRQRIALARAIVHKNDLIVLDEATSALDPQTTASILELLKDINKKYGITIVVITHQMSVVRDICNKVAIIEDGRLVEKGKVADIFANPKSDTSKRLLGNSFFKKLDIDNEKDSKELAG